MSRRKAAQKLAEIDEQRMELEAQSEEAQRLLAKEEEFEDLGEKQNTMKTQISNLQARLDRGDFLEAERDYVKREQEALENEILNIEQRREQLQKEITGLSYIVEQGKNFDKHRVFSNIRKLMQLKDVKLGQIEKEAGTQPGYMSRLEKEGNTSDPTVEFVVSAAKTLEVSVDSLINGSFAEITPTEAYILKFIKKLIDDTRKDSLNWKRGSESALDRVHLVDFSTGEVSHPLFGYTHDCDEYGNEIDRVYYNSKFFPDEEVLVTGACYNAELSNDAKVYLMNCTKPFESYYEMYLRQGDTKTVCCSIESCDEVASLMDNLYKEIELSTKRIHLDNDTKDIIENYLNPEEVLF